MRVHFVGIGGIGVSALAQYWLMRGAQVSGSDLTDSETIQFLKRKGVKIFIGKHKSSNLKKNIDLLIYSSALPQDNPELVLAKKLKIKIQSYPQALGSLTRDYFTIAVSGMHGKSTTSAMIALILKKAGFNPTVIIGTKLKEFGNSNFRMGSSQYLVIEADEYGASFLNYFPKIIILTNIEREHLDFYKNLNHILKTFEKYILRLPGDGFLITNKDDKNIKILKSKILKSKSSASPKFSSPSANKIKNQKSKLQFKIQNYSLKQAKTKKLKKILKIPGKHNVSNALAALTVARILKIPDSVSFEVLSKYKGAWRRFEIINPDKNGYLRGFEPKITLISDYAHHPTEIKSTIQGAKEKFPKRRFWIVFQPHQYQRTKKLFPEFTRAFDMADRIVLTEIFDVPGREKDKNISSKNLKEAIQKIDSKKEIYFIKNWQKIPNFLKSKLEKNDVILVMGAGDIYKIISHF